MSNSRPYENNDSKFLSTKNNSSLNYQKLESESPRSWTGDFGFGSNDRRFAFSRQTSFHQSTEQPPHTPISIISSDNTVKPLLSRTLSSIDALPGVYPLDGRDDRFWSEEKSFSGVGIEKFRVLNFVLKAFGAIRSGNRQMKRLFVLISLNVAYSTAELCIGLVSGRIGVENIL